MLSQSRTRCTLLPSQMPASRIHNKVLPQKYLIVSQIHAERITNSVASFCADNFIRFPVQLCKLNRVVRRANATLDMNYDSSFFVQTLLQPAQKNPTSQPTQDVRNFQIVKEQKNIQKKTVSFQGFSKSNVSNPKKWWSQTGSNRRPPACKAGALPAELWPPDLSSSRLALLVAHSLRSCTNVYTPSFVRNPPGQSRKVLRQALKRNGGSGKI